VAPKVEEPRLMLRRLIIHELVGKLHQVLVLVVTSCRHAQPVGGDIELFGGYNVARVDQTARAESIDCRVVKGTVGVRATADMPPKSSSRRSLSRIMS
jgi:hypothetical protein